MYYSLLGRRRVSLLRRQRRKACRTRPSNPMKAEALGSTLADHFCVPQATSLSNDLRFGGSTIERSVSQVRFSLFTATFNCFLGVARCPPLLRSSVGALWQLRGSRRQLNVVATRGSAMSPPKRRKEIPSLCAFRSTRVRNGYKRSNSPLPEPNQPPQILLTPLFPTGLAITRA